jgi:hypothetical protein
MLRRAYRIIKILTGSNEKEKRNLKMYFRAMVENWKMGILVKRRISGRNFILN